MNIDLENFLNPEKVAIIGASEDIGKVGGIMLKKAMKSKCSIFPVNPKHDNIFGLRCYKKVSDIKENIDLAVIAIPSFLVKKVLEECGEKSIKNVIIVTAGFSEIGKIKEEKEIMGIAEKYKMRILGPNCFGIFNSSKNLDLTFSASTPEKGKIAFISQSGALWSYIADLSLGKFGFSYFVSLGNMADLEFSDLIDYFSRDKETESIVLYIEKLKKGKEFIEICKKCKKKIYVVKAGSSQQGKEAAFSHTGSLATDYEIYKGAFKQAGVLLCENFTEAFSMASGNKIENNEIKKEECKRAIIITNAGGAGALLSDYLDKRNIKLVEKPIDILGTALASDYSNALHKIKSRKDYDCIFVVLTGQSMTEIEETSKVIVNFKKENNKDVVALFLGAKLMEKADNILRREGIHVFNNI